MMFLSRWRRAFGPFAGSFPIAREVDSGENSAATPGSPGAGELAKLAPMNRWLPRTAGLVLLSMLPGVSQEVVTIDAESPTTPFPHFWERSFGSGRAILALRDSYRKDLEAVKQVTGVEYLRFHGIFDDEVGVYKEDEHGAPVYNFAYVDEIYDGMLDRGVRPIVEISFMPRKLAFNPDALHPFWYKPNVSPPKSYDRWDALITAFARHLVDRYGIDEVSQWYFEVWNEPNIDFWNGIPRDKSYYALYEHTARALKAVDSRLRVGGPATAAAAWVPEFLKFAESRRAPVDFVSTHGYADDTVENLFGANEDIPMDDRVCRAVAKVRKEIQSSHLPHLPLFWTEWNVQGMKQSRDTLFVGPAVANTIRACDGMVDILSFWTFSDVFEEGGPIDRPFEGHFGLRAKGGINKPSFYGFSLLHRLGDQRIANPSHNLIATRRADGALVIAAWNLVDPDAAGKPVRMRLNFEHTPADAVASISLVDENHGNTLAVYRSLGSPQYPTREQIRKMNQATALPPPERRALRNGALELDLGVNALALIEVPLK
jgi:xylan 1,4-beta-xylosidase